jgi:hypothetical protein
MTKYRIKKVTDVIEGEYSSKKSPYSSGWDKDCYIYHKDMRSKDIKLGEVVK